MKRVILIITLLVFLLSMSGCAGKEKADETNETSSTEDNKVEAETVDTKASADQNGAADENTDTAETADNSDVDHAALSEKLAVQMAEGDYDETYDTLAPITKLQLSKDKLKQGVDATVEGVGKYIGVYSTKETVTDQYHSVEVLLEYEGSGIKFSFNYNKSNKLEGLWINFAALDTEPAANEIYEEEDIKIGDGDSAVDGRLTLPKKVTNPPVVILVHGSGTHDMDESVGPNKPFSDIAHGLAEYGIASIRYNEHLYQYPKSAPKDYTIYDDSLDDAAKAVNYAVNCGKVDAGRIIVIGHSLGGMMAPKIAADNKDVAGIICLAGSPRKLEDIIFDQNQAMVDNTDGITEAMKTQTMSEVKKGANKIKSLKEGDTEAVFDIPASYWISLNKIDTADIAENLDIQIFIAQGSADFQVYPDKDYAMWQELLKGKSNVTYKLYDNLNHLFMTSNGKMDVTEYNVKDTVNKQVIEDMAAWISAVK